MANVGATRKTGRACTICSHPDREQIDRDLALERKTQAEVARLVGCHRSSVSRHVKNHLLPTVGREVLGDPDLADLDVVSELKGLYARIKRHLDRAEEADNWRAIRAFHAEARQDLEFLARLLGQLQETQVNILIMPQWVNVRTALVDALAPYPEARTAAARALQEFERGGSGV